jgi:hypothetical protein
MHTMRDFPPYSCASMRDCLSKNCALMRIVTLSPRMGAQLSLIQECIQCMPIYLTHTHICVVVTYTAITLCVGFPITTVHSRMHDCLG